MNTREFKGKSLIEITNTYVSVDVETTGMSPSWDEIIEIGAVKVIRGAVVDRFSTLVNPGFPINSLITTLTGITNDDLACAPPIESVITPFVEWCEGHTILGHNVVAFDGSFLYDAAARNNLVFSNDYICTMRLARKLLPELQHHRLEDLKLYFSIETARSHRGVDDAEAAHLVYLEISKLVSERCIDLPSLWKRDYTNKARGRKASDLVQDLTKQDEESPIFGKHIVFTGKLENFTRTEIQQIVLDIGAIPEDGVTQKTNILVIGDLDYSRTKEKGFSSKQKKAFELRAKNQDISVITERDFFDMLTEG
ncbi:MAG: exonuclease domain-containing protein [Coriobacteriia bacterium]|nr:exonuclease domain-containing protein [Coriobacteriia bacterium]